MRSLCSVMVLMSALLVRPALAQLAGIQEGKPLPAVSATAASGRWQERAPFDPATYGKTRGVCPTNSPEAKLVLYTTSLDEAFFALARRVDRYVGEHPELAWSLVEVTEVKGAQQGGYTADELTVRLKEIQDLAQKQGIQHLSFLITAPGRPASPVVTIAHTRAVPKGNGFPIADRVVVLPLTTPLAPLESYLMSLNNTPRF